MERNRILAALVLVSALLHVGLVVFSPRRDLTPPPRVPKREAPIPVEVRRQQIQLARQAVEAEAPKTEPEPAPEALKPEAPKPAPKAPPKERPKPEAKKPPPARPEPKPETAPKPQAEAPEPARKPAPLVLSNVAMNGGVAVQTGSESNLFGDPSVNAKGWTREGPDAPRRPAGTEGGGGSATEEKVVIKPPKPKNQVQGVYPPEHRDLGRVVRVSLQLQVDADGNVVESKILKGDLPAFDAEARRAVAGLKFVPATRNGTPIPYPVKWTVVFLPEGT